MSVLSLLLVAPLVLANDVLVTTTDGKEIEGSIKIKSVKMTTDFGSVVIQMDKLARIEFGSPDVVITSSGVSLEGEIELKRLRIETDIGSETVKRADLARLEILVEGRPALSEDFTGSWVTSFGPMHLQQKGRKVSGSYGFEDEFTITGEVKDETLTFAAKESGGTSRGTFELWEGGDTFTGNFRFKGGDERFWGAYRMAPALAPAEPGEVTEGQTESWLNYHLHVPKDYDAKKKYPAIAFFHGSNMSSRDYVGTIVSAWPDLARDYILVGFDGEKISSRSADGERYYNFSYINFSGHEVGQKWRYRQSPGLVADALDELKKKLPIESWFAGGHSQGGFLTWTIVMFYPDKIAGAFPMSCNLLVQCEPDYFDDDDQRKLQREVSIAAIHGKRDNVVAFSGGSYCYERMQDGAFPTLRLFAPDNVGHEFALLPVEEAVRWLEEMTSSDPVALVKFGQGELSDGRTRCATAAAIRAATHDKSGSNKQAIATLHSSVDAKASTEAGVLLDAIVKNKNGDWVDDFWEFRRQFHFTPAAESVMDAYMKLREEHSKPAERLFNSARNESDDAARQEKYRELLELYYASKWYKLVKRWAD